MIKKLLIMVAALTLLMMSVNVFADCNYNEVYANSDISTGMPTLYSFDATTLNSKNWTMYAYANIESATGNMIMGFSSDNFQAAPPYLTFSLSMLSHDPDMIGTKAELTNIEEFVFDQNIAYNPNGLDVDYEIHYDASTGMIYHYLYSQEVASEYLGHPDLTGADYIAFYTDNVENAFTSVSLQVENCSEETCTPNWVASVWSSCTLVNGSYKQTQTFSDLNVCGLPETKPEDIIRSCGKSNNHYGATTDFEQVADPSNIPNAVYETAYGKIAWVNPISVVGVDLDTAVIIRSDLLFVNKSLVTPSMDSQANVDFQMDRTYDWCVKGFQMYYAEDAYSDIKQLAQAYSDGKAVKMADKSRIGLNCYDSSICRAVTCSQSKVGFQAQHFSGFGVLGNYSATYVAEDLPAIVIDGIGKFMEGVVAFAILIAVFVLYLWVKKQK